MRTRPIDTPRPDSYNQTVTATVCRPQSRGNAEHNPAGNTEPLRLTWDSPEAKPEALLTWRKSS